MSALSWALRGAVSRRDGATFESAWQCFDAEARRVAGLIIGQGCK